MVKELRPNRERYAPGEEVSLLVRTTGPDGVPVPTGPGPGRDLPETRVPAAHVFVLADNRGLGQDSRSSGPVPAGRWVGRVVAVRR